MPYRSLIAVKRALVFGLGAIIVGLVIVVMTQFSEWAALTYRRLSLLYPLFHFIVPPIGLSITAWITFYVFPGSERSGIPQIKTALAFIGNRERENLLSLRIAFGKLLLPIMGLLSGASVGFGGPATQVGASIMLSLGKSVKFPPHYMERGLIVAGSAAGFAALFSAPLAGIVFALEEMGRTLEEKIGSLVMTAIVLAGMTAYALLNRYIFFEDEVISMPWGISWLAIPLCGTAGGLAGGLFSKIAVTGGRWLQRSGLPIVVIAFVCGDVISTVNYYSDGMTVGTGYQQTKAILHSATPLDITFPLLKMLATCATFFSGIPSGIFVPSIATGAGLGSDLAHWFPIAPVIVMILLSMTAYFSGMLQTPLTAFVIVMEMTSSHEIMIPLMASAFIASGMSRIINPVPLYQALSESYTLPADRRGRAPKKR